jgi:hypothetical protein
LANNAKGGENTKPKAKGPHHHHFKKNRNKVLIGTFQIGIFQELVFQVMYSQLVSFGIYVSLDL